MNEAELATIIHEAQGLFPEFRTNKSQMNLFAEMVGGMDAITVRTALKNHRQSTPDFFNWPQFKNGLLAEQEHSRNRLRRWLEETVIEWIRHTEAQYDCLTDAQAIVAHFSSCWEEVAKEPDEVGAQQVRRMILGHCLTALMEIGWNRQEAESSARAAVGLADGEKIVVPKRGIFSEISPRSVSGGDGAGGAKLTKITSEACQSLSQRDPFSKEPPRGTVVQGGET